MIVVLTDGENGAGRVEFDEVLDDARRYGILMYPVVLPPNGAPQSGPSWRMTQLALDTGGKIAYVPSPLVRDGAWHQLQVRAR